MAPPLGMSQHIISSKTSPDRESLKGSRFKRECTVTGRGRSMTCACGCMLIQVSDPDDSGGCCAHGLKTICPHCTAHTFAPGATMDDQPNLLHR